MDNMKNSYVCLQVVDNALIELLQQEGFASGLKEKFWEIYNEKFDERFIDTY